MNYSYDFFFQKKKRSIPMILHHVYLGYSESLEAPCTLAELPLMRAINSG